VAYVFQSKGADGKPRGKWRFQFTDWTGRRRAGTGTRSKSQTEELARRVELKHDEIRRGLRPPPNAADRHRLRPFAEVAAEYCEWGEDKGGLRGGPWGTTHARMRRAHLEWWRDELRLERLGDLIGAIASAEKALRTWRERTKSSTKTAKNRAGALMAFCNWCVKRKYLQDNPVDGLSAFRTTPKTHRRPLEPSEIGRLLAAAPAERRLLYETALCTGLRANELRSLTAADLDAEAGGFVLHDEWTKNRKGGFQPLPAWLSQKLEDFANADKADRLYRQAYRQAQSKLEPPEGRLLYVPSNPARAFDQDLEAAGIPKIAKKVGGGDAKRIEVWKIDFHALRTTFATMLGHLRAGLKEVQALARHADPATTWNLCVRTNDADLSELAEGLGEVVREANTESALRPMAVGAEVFAEQEDRMVGAAGFEPAISSPPC